MNKNIKTLIEQHLYNDSPSPVKLHGDMMKIVNEIGMKLKSVRLISEIELYLTTLHMIVLANNQHNDERKKRQYIRLIQILLKDNE